MGVIGTFGSFTAARMGIYASQASLNVTGNNIANINTDGYCRQSMDLVSLHSGGSDRYSNSFNINVGYGVLCTSVSQARDPYLDIRYRNENSSVGAMGAKLSGLTELSKVLDEVGLGNDGEGVLEAQFNTIYEQLELLSRNVGSEEYDTLVRSSATTLCQLFNTYAEELETIRQNQETSLNQDIDTVNTLLSNIRDLNEQIRTAAIYGDKALELRDQRNNYIDELSSYMKIDVTVDEEPIDQYSKVEKIVITLADSGTPAIKLIDGIYTTQLERPKTISENGKTYDNFVDGSTDNLYRIQLAALKDDKGRYMKDNMNKDITTTTLLSDTVLYGSLQATREILTEKGEFASADDLAMDTDANIKRGIPYYQKALDALAVKFATKLNEANRIDSLYDANGNLVNPLPDAYSFYDGGNLFSISGDSDVAKDANGDNLITAMNISVSKSWSTGDVRVLSTTQPDEVLADGTIITNTTRNDNINHIISLFTTKEDYFATEVAANSATTGRYFNGTFQEFFASMSNTLAADTQTTTSLYNNYDAAALSLDNERESVSGVDLNEEATNMMQFQKSYSAACRLLTTIDSMLDTLINGTAL